LADASAQFVKEVSSWSSDGTNGIGILFVHGFTGSPASMRPWAEFLAAHGYSVRLPLLPGHGTTPKDLNKTTWDEWYETVEIAYLELVSKHQKVFIFALSMGGALTLRLAEVHQPVGIVLVNPLIHIRGIKRILIPIVSRVVSITPAVGNDIKKAGADEYAYHGTPLKAARSMLKLLSDVRARINEVRAPLLLLHSVDDHVVPASNSAWILAHVASDSRREIVLNDSFHVATIDNDAPIIFSESLLFVEGLS
jgi:carboxylesterase